MRSNMKFDLRLLSLIWTILSIDQLKPVKVTGCMSDYVFYSLNASEYTCIKIQLYSSNSKNQISVIVPILNNKLISVPWFNVKPFVLNSNLWSSFSIQCAMHACMHAVLNTNTHTKAILRLVYICVAVNKK